MTGTHQHHFVDGVCIDEQCGAVADGMDGLPRTNKGYNARALIQTGKVVTIDPASDIVVLTSQETLPPEAFEQIHSQIVGLLGDGPTPKVIVLDERMTFKVYRKANPAVELTEADDRKGYRSMMHCDHANEIPRGVCGCPADCGCREPDKNGKRMCVEIVI